jgi:hypothetical protein
VDVSEAPALSRAYGPVRGVAATITGVLLGYALLQLALFIDFSLAYCPTPDPYTPGGTGNGSAVLILLLMPLGAVLCLVLRRRLNMLVWLAIGLASGAAGWLLFLESERIVNGICTNAFGG